MNCGYVRNLPVMAKHWLLCIRSMANSQESTIVWTAKAKLSEIFLHPLAFLEVIIVLLDYVYINQEERRKGIVCSKPWFAAFAASQRELHSYQNVDMFL